MKVVLATDDTDDTDKAKEKKRVVLVALVAMVAATAAIFAVSIWRASRERPPVVVPAPTPVVVGSERRLTYWITVQKFREGKYKEPYVIAGEINFEAGDLVRVNVRTPEAGHLYILNEGPRGGETVPEFNFLFPSSTANKGSALLAADQQIQIPETSWFKFDAQEGVERLWLVFSGDAVPELESVKQFANKKAGGLIIDMTKNKLVHDFLTSHSTVKPEVDKGETLTTLKAPGKLLVYPVRLEHH